MLILQFRLHPRFINGMGLGRAKNVFDHLRDVGLMSTIIMVKKLPVAG